MSETNIEETEVEVLEEEQEGEQTEAQKFLEAYNVLCQEYGHVISSLPVFMARDDGTFSVVVQTSIRKLDKNI